MSIFDKIDKEKLKQRFEKTKQHLAKTKVVVGRKLKEGAHLAGEKVKKMKFNSADTVIGVRTSPVAHWIVWATLAFFVIIFLWAKFAELQEVTVAEGTVKPLTNVQSIQNMEGGIIKRIYVRENDIVQKGQILAELDPVRFSSSVEQAVGNADALKIRIIRLTAEIENKPLDFGMLKDKYPSLIESETNLYKLRQQQEQEMQSNLDLAQKEYELTKPLVKEGAAAEVDVIRLERQVMGLKAQLNEFNAQAVTELTAAKKDLESISANEKELKDRLNRTVIRSPVKGIVKEVRIQTIGGVVLSGAEIMSIVPLEETLLVEAQVKPSQIGFVHLGADAVVKITAYNYSVYGGLHGKVEQISADTIKNDKGETYYLVRVKTKINYLRTAKNPLYIIPGMTATVNIVTGKKTVLDYLLTPLARMTENAMKEK